MTTPKLNNYQGKLYLSPLPPQAQGAYNFLCAMLNRGLPFKELQAAFERLQAERRAIRVEKRLKSLLLS